jgi:hypothetical protein
MHTVTKIFLLVFSIVLLLFITAEVATATDYFPTSEYAGIHISEASDITSDSVTLSGYVDDPETDPEVWFIIGTGSGSYSYYVGPVEPDPGDGTFSYDMESYPLIAGKDFYIRAASENGRSSTEESITMEAITPITQTTFGTHWDNLQASNLSPVVIWGELIDAGGDVFGGGEGGQSIFAGILLGAIFLYIWIMHEDIAIPLQLGFMTGGILLYFVAPEFVHLAYVFVVLSVFALGYSVLRKSW